MLILQTEDKIMKLNTKKLRNYKRMGQNKQLEMLTCYDFQTARILDNTSLDLILVGDSVGNVVLGLENTIQVTLEHMITFGAAVKRGAPNKFTIVDLPFGTYSSFEDGIKNASKLFKDTNCEAIKLEGAFPFQIELIQRLTQTGIPIMGHIGLTPQSVHQQGGYYTHGKDIKSKERLLSEAKDLEKAGVFALVLECVDKTVAQEITNDLTIPTIGIGSGKDVDGQVLVTNDLLGMGEAPAPKFCNPMADLYSDKKLLIEKYLNRTNYNKAVNTDLIQ